MKNRTIIIFLRYSHFYLFLCSTRCIWNRFIAWQQIEHEHNWENERKTYVFLVWEWKIRKQFNELERFDCAWLLDFVMYYRIPKCHSSKDVLELCKSGNIQLNHIWSRVYSNENVTNEAFKIQWYIQLEISRTHTFFLGKHSNESDWIKSKMNYK